MIFLNEHPDLPIVAHNVEHDRDKVLNKAFERVENTEALPPNRRWRCTFNKSKGLNGLQHLMLDDVLEYFDFERRGEDDLHDAVTDCELTAKIYMKLMARPKPKKSIYGFARE